MVDLYLNGRLGNNLFQYAIGRIIAECLGYQLNIHASPEWSNLSIFKNLIPLSGESIHTPVETYTGHTFPLDQILSNKLKRKICLQGYFQRFEYYKNHKSKIREWFAVSESESEFTVTENDLIIHMRPRLEEDGTGRASFKYYCDLLEKLSYKQVYILGTGIDDSVQSMFKKYNPVYINRGEVEDFKFIKSGNKIIMSNSTFCWWAAWLSDAAEIYYPRTKTGYWSSDRPDINLIIDDESRYHLIQDQE